MYCVQAPHQSRHTLAHLILSSPCQSWYWYCHPHFTKREAKAQSNHFPTIIHGEQEAGPGFEPRSNQLTSTEHPDMPILRPEGSLQDQSPPDPSGDPSVRAGSPESHDTCSQQHTHPAPCTLPRERFQPSWCTLSGTQVPNTTQKPEVRAHTSLCWGTMAPALAFLSLSLLFDVVGTKVLPTP